VTDLFILLIEFLERRKLMAHESDSDQEPAEIRDQIKPLAQELTERLAKIDPNLVVTLSSAKNAPEKLRREHQGATPFDFTVTFNDFANTPHYFASAFAKAGDGFVNIHTAQ
jgi:hypothetical protein